jgi:hypothetical protein
MLDVLCKYVILTQCLLSTTILYTLIIWCCDPEPSNFAGEEFWTIAVESVHATHADELIHKMRKIGVWGTMFLTLWHIRSVGHWATHGTATGNLLPIQFFAPSHPWQGIPASSHFLWITLCPNFHAYYSIIIIITIIQFFINYYWIIVTIIITIIG